MICLMLLSLGTRSYGQKQIVVSSEKPYVEWLGGVPDADMRDLCLRVSFDDSTSTAKVSLSSANANLFGFNSGGIVYGQIFGCGRRLKTGRLPYKVEYDSSLKFILSGPSRKSLGRGYRETVFHSWLEYDGAMPVQSVTTMPEDSLVRTFSITDPGQEIKLRLRLRDIFFLERRGTRPAAAKKLYLSNYQDLHAEYDVTIQRNPCYGMDGRTAEINAKHKDISEAVKILSDSYPEGKVLSLEDFENFQGIKAGILQNFVKAEEDVSCPDLREAISSYNACIDSLLAMSCAISDEKRMALVRNLGLGLQRVDAEWLLHCARQIDELTAQWRIETKKSVKMSIKMQCEQLIEEVTSSTIGRGIMNEDDRRALNSFIKAKEYFNKTCR